MIVFAGPSLPPEARIAFENVDWRPPAEAGSLLALLDDPPGKVALIDGLFDTRAAVTHKECLALMTAGTKLFGASSMGALRGAELHPFGMIGVGSIYRSYRCGLLSGDDEVALVHGDERIGWKATTVPMVEVRTTLLAAVRQRLIDPEQARRLRALWHTIHYQDRDWPLMHRKAERLPAHTLEAISKLHVPLKQMDAECCVQAMAAWDGEFAPPPAPPETRFFKRLREEISRPPVPRAPHR